MNVHVCTSGRLNAELNVLQVYLDRVVKNIDGSNDAKLYFLNAIQNHVEQLTAQEMKRQFGGQ
jgi:hypothetical protein